MWPFVEGEIVTRPVLRQRGRTFSPGQTTLYTVHETESFAWDPGDHATEYYWGSTAGPGDPTRHIYNATNEIEGRLVPGGAWEDWADYDPEGNLLKKGQPYSGDLFTLDAWHRVVETRHVGAGSPSTLTFINVLDAARAVEFIDGQAAIFAVIGDGRTWAYSFARNTWAPVPLETDSEMGFASSYAQVVYSARCGVLVNVGAQSRGTAVMRPDLGKIEWE